MKGLKEFPKPEHTSSNEYRELFSAYQALEQKLAVAVEALDRIVNGAPYVTYYERYMDDGTIIPTYGEVAEKALALIKPDAQKKENANGK